jgi:UDP-3-O-[3-hydroxymyristoyl] N-acetylglucosamine deacetylase/3-hydroxyacyl-[acyl-carrier-protein] dehydratase
LSVSLYVFAPLTRRYPIFKCDLITPIRRGICHMQANAYANGKLVAEELMAQIAKKQ